MKEKVLTESNFITERFVMSIEDFEADKSYFKARFVAQCHRYKEMSNFIHNSTTVCQSSIKILLSLAVVFGFRMWSIDVNNAYLQSK